MQVTTSDAAAAAIGPEQLAAWTSRKTDQEKLWMPVPAAIRRDAGRKLH